MSRRPDAIDSGAEAAGARLGSRRMYSGRVISVDVDTVRFPNGQVGELEMVRHPGASAVVPFLSDPAGEDPQILLIRQYRYAAESFIYEVPAGRLSPGENPEACALRELREETGCTAAHVERLTTIYTTPGFTDEKIHLFVATGLTQGSTEHESDEIMRTEVMPLSVILEKIRTGEICDGKSVVALLYAARFKAAR